MGEEIFDLRYTDRDVREDPDLKALAERYIETYGGDFDPLVEAHDMWESEGELTVPVARKVLNCMRHDRDVAPNMPRPHRASENVVPLQPKWRRSHKRWTEGMCDNPASHDPHQPRGEDGIDWCKGVPYPINRMQYERPVHIKAKFAITKTGALVHKTTGEGYVVWHPNPHEGGWQRYTPYRLTVMLQCRNPSYLRDPGAMYLQEPVHLYTDPQFGKRRCPRCF